MNISLYVFMHGENKGQKIPFWPKLILKKKTIKNRQYMSINKYYANRL